jgi:methylmalonyl-CoA mutase
MGPMSAIVFDSSFPPATRETWLRLVEGVLKGKDFDKALVATTYDGLRIAPLYDKASGTAPMVARPPGAPWRVVQRMDHPDPSEANAQALADLESGANGLALVTDRAPAAHGFGLPATAEALATALEGVYLDAGIALSIDAGPDAAQVAQVLAELCRARGIAPAVTDIRFGLAPFADQATGCGTPDTSGMATAVGTLRDLRAAGFGGPVLAADGRPVHAAGGSEAQELAFALASTVAMLRALEGAGLALEDARAAIEWRLAADADQFLTIAKLRAARQLMARLDEACGLPARPVPIMAETAWRVMTRRDPWVNLLRVTMAVFAAGIGGADTVVALPFTQALGLPDAFARRLARNTQLILIEESNLARVADPAAGAGGFEALTAELARTAWEQFQAIEAAGGLGSVLAKGTLQAAVAATRAERLKAVARRKDALTGTSEFPLLAEAPVAVLRPAPVPEEASSLAPIRLAASFEALRDASDATLAATGRRPRVFLANLGPLSAFTARTTFAKNLFEAGGIETVGNDALLDRSGATDLAAIAEAFRASGAVAACLCSSDEVYKTEATAAARALKAAGARRVTLAGRPGSDEAALREAGVDAFAHVGIDAVAFLTEAQRA